MKENLNRLKALALSRRGAHYARRSDLHLARKAFHISGSFLTLGPIFLFGSSQLAMAAIMACVLALVMSVEYGRARFEWFNQLVLMVFRPFLRDSEVGSITGIPFYMASCLFAFLVFPFHVAVLSILYLTLGDPSSSFFGVLYGRSKLFPNKSLEGTLGGFVICSLATAVYLHSQGLAEGKFAVMVLLGGFAGSVAELLPLNVDDNFAIPVVSGMFMSLAFWCADLPM